MFSLQKKQRKRLLTEALCLVLMDVLLLLICFYFVRLRFLWSLFQTNRNPWRLLPLWVDPRLWNNVNIHIAVGSSTETNISSVRSLFKAQWPPLGAHRTASFFSVDSGPPLRLRHHLTDPTDWVRKIEKNIWEPVTKLESLEETGG